MPSYNFAAIQRPNETWDIIEVTTGKVINNFSTEDGANAFLDSLDSVLYDYLTLQEGL